MSSNKPVGQDGGFNRLYSSIFGKSNKEKAPDDASNVLNEVLLEKTGLKGEVNITMKDLAKVRGEGLGMVATSYNQIKLLCTKGIVIRDKDVEKIAKSLDSEKIDKISDKFDTFVKKNANLIIPEKEQLSSKAQNELFNGKVSEETRSELKSLQANRAEIKAAKMEVKQTKQTANAAKAFAKALGNADRKEETSKIETSADRLKAVLELRKQNPETLIQSVLFDLRSVSGIKIQPRGMGSDFIGFLRRENKEINNNKELKDAFVEFQAAIRNGTFTPKGDYSKDKPLKNFQKANRTVESFNLNAEEIKNYPIKTTIQIINNRIKVFDELNTQSSVLSKESLNGCINSSHMGGLVESVYKKHNLGEEFNFIKEINAYENSKAKYESTQNSTEKEKLKPEMEKQQKEIFNKINAKNSFVNISEQMRSAADNDDKIEATKNHLLNSAASNYAPELRSVLLTGKPLENKESAKASAGQVLSEMPDNPEEAMRDFLDAADTTDLPNLNLNPPKKKEEEL